MYVCFGSTLVQAFLKHSHKLHNVSDNKATDIVFLMGNNSPALSYALSLSVFLSVCLSLDISKTSPGHKQKGNWMRGISAWLVYPLDNSALLGISQTPLA